MKQVFIKNGKISVDQIPSPLINDKEVLVQVYYSCVSTGTEVAIQKQSSVSILQRALKQPQKIKKVLDMILSQGLASTIARVRNTLDSPNPIGYSAAGIVLQVGSQITDIKPNDRVACAGAGIANHAEFIAVPRNLLVKVPDEVSLELAATTTLGSIALQGIRRADPKLGETVAIIGLGILGQLTAQMLKANGVRVVGIDINQGRLDLALSLGLDHGIMSSSIDPVEQAIRLSNGNGVDSVIITASSESNAIISQAMKMCRRKGKVVIVGAVGLNLQREDFYKKELDVFISTSYGPGRYDDTYELHGRDYPYGYVRWTENRNMSAYLELLKEKRIGIQPLIQKTVTVDQAPALYEELKSALNPPLIALLEYNKESVPDTKVVLSSLPYSKSKINVGLIGAGGFSQGVLLPILAQLNNHYHIHAIASKTGSHAQPLAKMYNAAYATTDYHQILDDKDIDMVVVATRHNLHAQIATEAARAGKAVFLEKPMALNQQDLESLVKVLEETKVPFTVGFNRRFSPFSKRIKEIVSKRINPMIINYRMNAGFIPKDHWVQTEEGGGRNIGEACHIYDLFNFLTEAEVSDLSAHSINPKTDQYCHNDNFVATIKYSDGSVASLIYTALGSKDAPKEQMDIYFDGKIISLNDYKELKMAGLPSEGLNTATPQKGHIEELTEFARSIKAGANYPIPLEQLIRASEISFQIETNFS